MEIRHVTWVDSMGGHGWEPVEEVKKTIPMTIQTAGFVVDETETHVTILQSYDERTDGRPHGDNYISIPKFAITHSRTLRK